MAFKQQQHRWACGSLQVLLKMSKYLWRAKLPLYKRLSGYIHLTAYLSHPLMLLLFLSTIPLVIRQVPAILIPGWLSLAALGPPLFFAVSQQGAYPDWKRRFLFFPVLMSLGVGLAINNTVAIFRAISGKPVRFDRTPKFHLEKRSDTWAGNRYKLPIHWTVWIELVFFLTSAILLVFSIHQAPFHIPALVIFTISFGFIGLMGLWEGLRPG